ncbi:MAG: polyphosphate polymerase domain-containing protein [Lachnospiraceae bacterium]|nr:polyphosphate polymerase domain-containing protein [Lachnospiraceae bacterium]
MGIDVFHRFEKKYLIDLKQYENITAILRERMDADVFSKDGDTYSLRSLYYDTPHYELISEAFTNSRYKEKLRLRTYGDPQLTDNIYIEIKKKINGVGDKRRVKLTLAEAYEFMKTGELADSEGDHNSQVIREIRAILDRYHMNMRPTALIAYDRVAFSGRDDKGLRISFDKNVIGRTHDLKLELGAYGDPLLDPSQVIMEIKAPDTLPIWLAHLLAAEKAYPNRFSKYRAIYQKNMLKARQSFDNNIYAY